MIHTLDAFPCASPSAGSCTSRTPSRPTPTDLDRFREGSLTYGPALVPVWREAHHEVGGFIEGATKFGYDIGAARDGLGHARRAGRRTSSSSTSPMTLVTGVPAGQARRRAARPARRDGHAEVPGRGRRGAAAASGRDRAEACRIAASLDFHGNVSPQMAETANILVGYQTYPHIDQRARGLLAAELLTRTVKGEVRPVCHVAKPPMILNLLGQDTDREPMAGLMARARDAEKRPGVLSVSLMAGFPYADVPRDGAERHRRGRRRPRELAKHVAEELAAEMWDVREQLYVAVPGAGGGGARRHGLDTATRSLLVDLGDNIGGGSAGDGTVLLAELLRAEGEGFRRACCTPRPRCEQAKTAGVGGTFEVTVGGAVDRLHGEPVHVRGVVRSLHDGKWVETEARHGGRRQNDQGHTAVIDLGDGNTLVLNSLRTPPFSLGQLTSLGIDPRAGADHRGEGGGRVQGGVCADRRRDHRGGHARPDRDQPGPVHLQAHSPADVSARR